MTVLFRVWKRWIHASVTQQGYQGQHGMFTGNHMTLQPLWAVRAWIEQRPFSECKWKSAFIHLSTHSSFEYAITHHRRGQVGVSELCCRQELHLNSFFFANDVLELHWIEKVCRSECVFLNVSELEQKSIYKKKTVLIVSIDGFSFSIVENFFSFSCFISLQSQYLKLLIEQGEDVINLWWAFCTIFYHFYMLMNPVTQ